MIFAADGKNGAGPRRIRVKIDGVLYSERFTSNLLSGERMCKELGWEYHCTPEETYAITPGGSRVSLSSKSCISVIMGATPERACAGTLDF